jgi:hypothetical protein
MMNEYVSAFVDAFLANKRLADRAVAQVPDDKLYIALDDHTNSIAIIMKHVSGNLLSRWTDFLTTDGEKPSRDRDSEFIDAFSNRDEILEYWELGWSRLLSTVSDLNDEDMNQIVTIRGVTHPVPLAMTRSLGHTCYHVGQIVQLARYHAGEQWQTLTIPRGASREFNEQYWGVSGGSHS